MTIELDQRLLDERISHYGRLVETQRRLHQIFDPSLRDRVGISITWYEALLRLARAPEQRLGINELGESLGLTSGGATRLVDRLEEQGYIERVSCPTDRRVSWAHLTGDGLDVVLQATEVHLADLEQNFSAHLDAADTEALEDLFQRLSPDSG